MLGAIIGDIIGSRWEFHPTNDYHFEWISAQNDYTDDTICTVAVADAIVHQSDDVLREAEKSAACSHDHPEGIRGAPGGGADHPGCPSLEKKIQRKRHPAGPASAGTPPSHPAVQQGIRYLPTESERLPEPL